MTKIITTNSFDATISFDEKWLLNFSVSRWDTQDKVNDLLNIQKDYEYLNKLKNELRKYKHFKKKTKQVQEEISFLEIEIDEIEQYINFILQTVTKH